MVEFSWVRWQVKIGTNSNRSKGGVICIIVKSGIFLQTFLRAKINPGGSREVSVAGVGLVRTYKDCLEEAEEFLFFVVTRFGAIRWWHEGCECASETLPVVAARSEPAERKSRCSAYDHMRIDLGSDSGKTL